jgi:hypothetical protein
LGVGGAASVGGGGGDASVPGGFAVVVDPELLPVVVAYIKYGLLIVMALIKTKISSEVAANEIVLPCVTLCRFTQ